MMFFSNLKNRIKGKLSPYSESLVFWVLLAMAALVTLIIYPSLLVSPQTYSVGDIAVKNVKAPRELNVVDEAATQENQRRAVETVLTVYDRDEAMNSKIIQRVREAFASSRKIVEEHSKALAEAEKNAQAQGESPMAPPQELSPIVTTEPVRPLADLLRDNKKIFDTIIGIETSEGDYRTLGKHKFSQDIDDHIVQILRQILGNGVVANKEVLLEEADRGIILRGLQSQSEEYVQSLRRFYSFAQARTMVRVVGDPILKDLNHTLINAVVDISQKLVRPNITLNMQETLDRQQQAKEEITPVHYKIKAGEMLLREGERVTAEHVLKLNALHDDESQKRTLVRSAGMGFIILFFLIAFHLVYLRPEDHSQDQDRGRNLVFLCLVLLFFFVVARLFLALSATFPHEEVTAPFSSPAFFAAPLAAGSMILCLFLGLEIALPFAIAMGFFASALFENPFQTWTYFFLNSTMGAYWIKECRERNVFIKAGAKVGLLNVGLVAALYLYSGAPSVKPFLMDVVMAFVGGMGAGILTAGIIPLVELSFGFATDIKLLELANLDQPVLRRLMLEAPGTYHHSVIVGSLVEAAATAIGANPLLARVCGYYHDIGKIKKPLYFIENQMGGKNRHDKLAPSMSSLILIAHVRDGVEMATRHKLGQAIADTIQQHHGTSLISYFYEKAKQIRGEDAVSEDDFRYPGPKPQTKEAGLVMLADIVEAASRTLENPTPARIQGLVQRLINNVFSDGQLDECELTLKDLHQIAKSFNQILAGIYHHRVEYIESTPKGEGKKPHAGSNGQSAKNGDQPEKNGNGSTASLKRLGLS